MTEAKSYVTGMNKSEEVKSGFVKDQNKHADGEHMWGLNNFGTSPNLIWIHIFSKKG